MREEIDIDRPLLAHWAGTRAGLLRSGCRVKSPDQLPVRPPLACDGAQTAERSVPALLGRRVCFPPMWSRHSLSSRAAWAAASRATGTRKGEQLT